LYSKSILFAVQMQYKVNTFRGFSVHSFLNGRAFFPGFRHLFVAPASRLAAGTMPGASKVALRALVRLRWPAGKSGVLDSPPLSSAGESMTQLKVNGRQIDVVAAPQTPLLWVLRDELGLTGTKYGCGIGQCGACTVHIDGKAVRSCLTPLGSLADSEVTTIEGLGSAEQLHPVQAAWIQEQVPQCGYCQPGMIMATAALIVQNPNPTDTDINQGITNICRCGTYPRIRRAVKVAAMLVAESRETSTDQLIEESD
jgi:isoquinoline 1-oxidoreductase alpha subunit